MTLLTPSGDTTGATDLARINALSPNDEMVVGDYYINGSISDGVKVIRGIELNHWTTGGWDSKLTCIHAVAGGTYTDNAMLVQRGIGALYRGFTLDATDVPTLNCAEVGGSTGVTFEQVAFTGGLVGLRATSRWTSENTLELVVRGGSAYNTGSWGVNIDQMSDSSIIDAFDCAFTGRHVDGSGGIRIERAWACRVSDISVQDLYGPSVDTLSNLRAAAKSKTLAAATLIGAGPALLIEGTDCLRIINNKFDQTYGGLIDLGGSVNVAILEDIVVAFNQSFTPDTGVALRIGGATNHVRSRDNTWAGTSGYKADPRQLGPLIGKFDDNFIGDNLYADADTQAIMAGLVS